MGFNSPPKKNSDDPANPTRRGFLKMAAVGLAASAVAVAGNEYGKNLIKQEEENGPKIGPGLVTKKEQIGKGDIPVNGMIIPPRYILHVEIEGQSMRIQVPEYLYKDMQENEQVKVTFTQDKTTKEISVRNIEK